MIKGQLVSLRALEIENVLRKRYGKDAAIQVSRNCLDGKRIYNEYKDV